MTDKAISPLRLPSHKTYADTPAACASAMVTRPTLRWLPRPVHLVSGLRSCAQKIVSPRSCASWRLWLQL